jgi:hypothetical protein
MPAPLLLSILAAWPLPAAQKPIPEEPLNLLDQCVLSLGEREVTAREVLQANPWDPSNLIEMLERDETQARLLFNSPAFLDRCHSFADSAALDFAKVPTTSEEAILAEASIWAQERSISLKPKAILLNHGLEIQNRARLLGQLPSEFGTGQLRKHMLQSVPELFGELSFSWIRLPLIDLNSGSVLSSKDRKKQYDRLDSIASKIASQEITWEEAVKENAVLDSDKKKHGYKGLVRRHNSDQYEIPVLKAIFDDLGFTRPQGNTLRGPVTGQAWLYLLRLETIRIRGVVDLQSVRDKVDRSLRESLIQTSLSRTRSDLPAQFRLPLS